MPPSWVSIRCVWRRRRFRWRQSRCCRALAYRDSGAPALKHQLLICPLTDWSTDTDSYRRCRHGYFLSEELMQYFGGHYLNGADDLADWRCSPLLAARHDGLPPATVLVGGFDPLRDGGEAYAQQLQRAGVEAQLIEYPGQFHDFQLIDGLIPEAIEATEQLALALTRALSK
jgi:acetyl esterase